MWSNKRMVMSYFIANFIFGMIMMLPFRAVITRFAGHSVMATKLAESIDMNFVFDLMVHNKNLSSVIVTLALVVTLTYWLINLFLSGGALAVFAADTGYDKQQFWGSAGSYFGRFLRLGLFSIPVFALLFAVQFLVPLALKIVYSSDAPQNISYWAGWLKFALRTLGILFWAVILDYARIMTVAGDERKMSKTLWRGVKFALNNFARVFTLALLMLIVGSLVLLIYNPLANALSAPSVVIVVLLFLLQQLYMLFRMGLRLTLLASETTLFKSLSGSHAVATRDVPGEDVGLSGAPA